jgi:hypothetical protein
MRKPVGTNALKSAIFSREEKRKEGKKEKRGEIKIHKNKCKRKEGSEKG